MTATSASGQLGGTQYLRLVLLGALIGVPAALVAALFLAAAHGLEHVLWHNLPDALGDSAPPWYLVIGLPVIGALIVLAARKLLPGDGGESPLRGLSSTPTPIAYAPGVALAALATLGFGAVLGPEAPVIALGSVVGMICVRWSRVTGRPAAVLSSAGSFSALSALFDGPLVAGMLLIESGLGLGAALLPALLPGLVAAAVGYLIFIGFGHWGGLNAPGLVVPDLPAYQGTHLGDLLVGLVAGIVVALLLTLVRRGATAVGATGTARLGMPALLIAGAVLVGVLAELAELLGANSQDVLFSGQTSLPAMVAAGSTSVVLVTLAAKAIAYAICLGCGFRGGPIFPAIFIGVAVTSFPIIWFNMSPTVAIAVGAAAGMAAQTRLLFAPLLLASLLVGRDALDTLPAAVFASVGAWLVMTALDRRAAADHPKPVA